MKKELTYHGNMLKQECEAMLNALENGEENAVLFIANRLDGFVNEILKKNVSVFVDKKVDTRKIALNNLFSMAEGYGCLDSKKAYCEIAKTFESFIDLYIGIPKKLAMFRDVLTGRIEYLTENAGELDYSDVVRENYVSIYKDFVKTVDAYYRV